MYGLSLCSGIGGLELGVTASLPGYRTVCYVEREAFCASILAARMADGRLHEAPIWSDIATFDGKPWRGVVDIVIAGYPCQPFSVAGRRHGDKDPRHLWPHVARIIQECRPSAAFLENVPGHVSMGLRDVCADLRGMGYDVQAGIFSAAECGAPHVRKRLFILAANADRARRRQRRTQPTLHERGKRPDGSGDQMADTDSPRQSQSCGGDIQKRGWVGNSCGGVEDGAAEPGVGRSIDGLSPWMDGWENGLTRTTHAMPDRIDRLRALGNAVVPQVAATALTNLISNTTRVGFLCPWAGKVLDFEASTRRGDK
jgi:DNA (cytosine-5)-methyltransferase 1